MLRAMVMISIRLQKIKGTKGLRVSLRLRNKMKNMFYNEGDKVVVENSRSTNN